MIYILGEFGGWGNCSEKKGSIRHIAETAIAVPGYVQKVEG